MKQLSPDTIVYYRELGMYYHISSCDLESCLMCGLIRYLPGKCENVMGIFNK